MNELFQGFKYIREYLDDLLVLTTVYWTDHFTILVQVLMKLQGKVLKCTIIESHFPANQKSNT